MTQMKEELRRKLSEYLNVHYVEKKRFIRIPDFLRKSKEVRNADLDNEADHEEDFEDEILCDGSCIAEQELNETYELWEEAPACFEQLPNANEALPEAQPCYSAPGKKIDDYISDSFVPDGVAKRLNLYMYERDITTAMIYERCFVNRKLISKITSKEGYHPSKNTMLALCIGLQLNLQEGEEFLLLAGYSFSNSSKYDLIIKFMLENGIYDIDVINEMLFEYNQPCIGA